MQQSLSNVTLDYLRRLASTRTAPAPDPMPTTPLIPTPTTRLDPPPIARVLRVASKGKSVCKVCKRDIYMAEIEQRDGTVVLTELDAEIMTGAEYPKGRRRMLFRRNHAERCGTY